MSRLLLCTDLDRTLLPNGVAPESPRARPLFARLAADADVTLVYVTGRDAGLVDEALATWKVPVPDVLIGDVGTTIAERRDGAWVRWPAWDEAIARDWSGRGGDAIRDLLQGRDDGLVHPRIGLGTSLLPDDHEFLEKGRAGPNLLEIPIGEFHPYGGPRPKAKGPHQITHGDIARACGYCDAIKYYQTPAARWMKTYEDRAFRWLIGTHGTPLDIPNVCQIRHIVKGRYKKDSWWTKVRKTVRMSQDT